MLKGDELHWGDESMVEIGDVHMPQFFEVMEMGD